MVLLYAKSFYKWSLHVWLPLLFIENILHKLVPVLNAHFLNATYFSNNATLFAKGFHIEEWYSLGNIILQVQFANLFSFIVYREHIA